MTVKQHRIIQWIAITLILSLGATWYYQTKVKGAATTISEDPSFQADLKSTLDLQAGVGKPTFTRATVATVTDFEGLIKNVKSGEARFEGARRVENLATYSEDMSNAVWIKTGAGTGSTAVVTANYATAPDGTMTADRVQLALNGGTTINDYSRIYQSGVSSGLAVTFSIWLKTTDASTKSVQLTTSGQIPVVTVTGTWQRFALITPTGYLGVFAPLLRGGFGTSDSADLLIWGAQLEKITGQANQNPSEYVSTNVLTSAPYHGANVDGVKYFTTYNGNTVASNVVTEGPPAGGGASIPDATLHGYVAEGARTNLLTYSEQFDNATWFLTNATRSADQIAGPGGAVNADKLIENTSGPIYHQLYKRVMGLTTGTTYTASVYVKDVNRGFVAFNISVDSFGVDRRYTANVDLSTGAVTTATKNSPIGTANSVTALPNGWWRITITATLDVGTDVVITVALSNSASPTYTNYALPYYTGDGTSGIYLWGAQLEAGSFASSYIPTTSASVTRNGDILSYPSNGNVLAATGSMVLEGSLTNKSTAAFDMFLSVSNGGSSNYFALLLNSNTRPYFQYVTNGVNQGAPGSANSDFFTNGSKKLAARWATNDLRLYISAGLVATDPLASMLSVPLTKIDIGTLNSLLPLYGAIKNVKIWKKALTDTQLTNMTSTNSAVSQSAVKKTTVGADGSSFQADLKSTLDLQAGVGKPTFTRATTATVTDFEGLIKNVKSGEARFEGARRVENLLTFSEDFSNARWAVFTSGDGTAVVSADKKSITFSVTSSGRAFINTSSTLPAGSYTLSVTQIVIGTPTTGTIGINGSEGNITSSGRVSISGSESANQNNRIGVGTASTQTGPVSITISFPQLENVTGQANQNPSEYVSTNVKTSAPYHGANVDGVKYFTTYNGNTVASNVVTEATGASIPDATLHGYVAEGARTNLMTYSEQFDNASWTKLNSTITANVTVAPDGNVTADKFIETAVNYIHYIYDLKTLSATSPSTASIYMKAGERTYGALEITTNDGSGRYTVVVDLNTGLVTATSVSGNPTNTSNTVTSVGNGWYRVSVTATFSGGTSVYIVPAISNQAVPTFFLSYPTYQGDGTSGIYLWGAQLEAGSFASSYIPTTTASVTRNSDVLTYPTAGNIDGTKGSVYMDVASEMDIPAGATSGYGNNYLFDMGINNGVFQLYQGQLRMWDGSGYFYSPSFTPVKNTRYKVGSKWGSSSMKGVVNGTLGTVGTFDGYMNPTATLHIANYGGSSGNEWNGTIRNVKIWKKALTDAQLTNMTSSDPDVSAGAVKKTTVNVNQNDKLTNGLVGLWSFNGKDISGTTAYDRSGQNNNGTLTGGVTKVTGKVGQALSFDGTSGYVDTGNWSNSLTRISVCTWVKPSSGTRQDYVSKWFSPNYQYVLLQGVTASKFQFYVDVTNGSTPVGSSASTTTIVPGTWYHVCGTYDGSNIKLYVNGVKEGGSVALSGNLWGGSTGNNVIGKSGSSSSIYTSATLDEVRIYNRALSATEVSSLYNLGR